METIQEVPEAVFNASGIYEYEGTEWYPCPVCNGDLPHEHTSES